MSYATVSDMQDQYPQDELIQRTNLDNPDAVAIDESVLQRALNDASAEIDCYLGAYDLPLADTPALLNRFCRVIARKNLYHDAPEMDKKPQWRQEYEDVVGLLAHIQSGAATLPGIPSDQLPAPVFYSGNTRVFNRTRLAAL